MPNISVELLDVEDSITRPVVTEVVRQLCQITGIPSDITVMFPGDINQSYQVGSDLTGQANPLNGKTKLPFTDQMKIVVTENDAAGSMILTAARQRDQVPIFMDDKLRVSLRPIKAPMEISLQIEYRAKSKAEAEAWKNRLQTKLHTYGELNLHTAQYGYMVPRFLMQLLENIHANREAIRPYDQDYAEYLAGFGTSRATVVTTLDGKTRDYAVAEEQIRIQGQYEFEVRPDKAENSGEGNAWTSTFTYKFQYDKTIGVNAVYPVIVHNQLLDECFLIEDNGPNDDNYRKAFSNGGGALSKFENTHAVDDMRRYNRPVHIPSFDEFNPIMLPAVKTQTMVSCLFAVNNDAPKSIINLKDMGDYQIDPDVLEYMQSEWSNLTKSYQLPFIVSLYKDNKLMSEHNIHMDNQLNVVSNENLDPRDYHQVRLGIYKDIDQIRIESLKRLKKYPRAAIKTLLAMGVTMGQLKLLAQRVSFVELMKDFLPDTGLPMDVINRNRRQTSTVMLGYVAAGSYESDLVAMRLANRK